MKNLKRILSMALLAIMIFTACGEKPTDKVSSVLADGVYTSSAKSHGGDLKVEMEIKNGKFFTIKVLSHSDDEEYAVKATEKLPEEIIKAQSLGVDVISGATMTSRGILGAAAQCVRDAGGNAREFGYVPTGEVADGQAITIYGLKDNKEMSFTGEEIKAMEQITKKTVSVNASGESTDTDCKGTLLENILQSLGVSQKDYGSIILTATDGYSIEIPSDVLQKRDIIIAYEVNGEACDLRSVVPDERAMYWVKFIEKIELMNPKEDVATNTLYIAETLIEKHELEQVDYKYKENVDKAVAMADMLAATEEKSDFLTLSAIDGWGKTEKWDLANGQYYKITGEDSPMFVGPDLPEGMRLKETLYIKISQKAIISASMMQKKLDKENTGVSLEEIFNEMSLTKGENYIFTAADGYTVTIKSEDIPKGKLTIKDNAVTVSFDTLEKSTTVKQLYTISSEG